MKYLMYLKIQADRYNIAGAVLNLFTKNNKNDIVIKEGEESCKKG